MDTKSNDSKFTYREFCLMMKRYEKEKSKKESRKSIFSSLNHINEKETKGRHISSSLHRIHKK